VHGSQVRMPALSCLKFPMRNGAHTIDPSTTAALFCRQSKVHAFVNKMTAAVARLPCAQEERGKRMRRTPNKDRTAMNLALDTHTGTYTQTDDQPLKPPFSPTHPTGFPPCLACCSCLLICCCWASTSLKVPSVLDTSPCRTGPSCGRSRCRHST
jgi:hypothetical protein